MISSAIHDVDVVGDLAAEVQILLDQQDRHALLVAQELQRPADILDDRGLDALGRLVEHQDLGSGDQRTPDGELLLLATREVTAAPAQHGLQHGEEVKM